MVVSRLARFIKEMWLIHVAYRCDREHSLNSLMEDAIATSGDLGKRVHDDGLHEDLHIGKDDADDSIPEDAPMLAVPELAHPGESASNGLAERGVRTLEEQARTHLAALEARTDIPIPAQHPILHWIVQHAAYALNRYQLGPDGKTPFGRLHGKELSERTCEF